MLLGQTVVHTMKQFHFQWTLSSVSKHLVVIQVGLIRGWVAFEAKKIPLHRVIGSECHLLSMQEVLSAIPLKYINLPRGTHMHMDRQTHKKVVPVFPFNYTCFNFLHSIFTLGYVIIILKQFCLLLYICIWTHLLKVWNLVSLCIDKYMWYYHSKRSWI